MKRLSVLSLVVAFACTACASPPPHSDVAAIRVVQRPPAPRSEIVPPAPASNDFWVGGYWRWDGGDYVWEAGRWIEPRPDEDYVQAHWARQGEAWIFHAAHWQAARGYQGIAVVTAPSPPPQPKIEAITPPPGIEFIWIAGHYRLDRGQYAWQPGRWERLRPGEHWLSAHWIQRGPSWAYVPGRWEVD